jgi:hypothetical protein
MRERLPIFFADEAAEHFGFSSRPIHVPIRDKKISGDKELRRDI